MLYKNVSDNAVGGIIKDIDEKTSTVTGYFSIFGNVDSDGDMIMPGAYKRTLQNNYHRLKHLNQHNSLQVLSGTKKGNLLVKEDNRGLYFESRMSETSYGKDVIILYKDGALDEHSVGFNIVKQQKASDYNEIIEMKLWEGSSVTWAANEAATSKSMDKTAICKMQEFMKALKAGQIDQEELCDTLELTFKQLEQTIQDLTDKGTQPAPALDPPKEENLTPLYLSLQTQILNFTN